MVFNMKSFGEHFLEHFSINGLTPPILARAIGVWLGDLERAMVNNAPTKEMVDDLLELSQNFGAQRLGIDPLTPAQINQWVDDWDNVAPEFRTTVTSATWAEPQVLTTADLTPGDDKDVWLQNHPAFTLDAWKQTWGHTTQIAEDYLQPLRWRPHREQVGGKLVVVWRWNPLRKSRPLGRPSPLHFQLDSEGLKPAIHQRLKDKLKTMLDEAIQAGVKQVKIQEVARVFYGREIKNSSTLQRLRTLMAECGWKYNNYDHVWRPEEQK